MILCPLCNAPTDKLLSDTLRRGTGKVYHCAACDLGFLVSDNPRDDAEYYKGAYRDHVSHRAEGGATNAKELFDTYSKYQGDRLSRVMPHLNYGGSILEIGASAGQFLHHLGHCCATRCAIELDPACCEFMRAMGIAADNKVFSESKFSKEQFDVVCAFQTLEHVAEPVLFLDDMRQALKPNGVAFVEVPNLREALLTIWENEAFRKFYFHDDHRWYFTAASLRKMAEAAGFKSIKIDFVQDYNLISTLGWLSHGLPQADCHMGLSPINLQGQDDEMSLWLTTWMRTLDAQYTEKLVKMGGSSNLMMELRC